MAPVRIFIVEPFDKTVSSVAPALIAPISFSVAQEHQTLAFFPDRL